MRYISEQGTHINGTHNLIVMFMRLNPVHKAAGVLDCKLVCGDRLQETHEK